MAGLSDSFTKLVMKIGENVGTRRNDCPETPTTPNYPYPSQRPGSPFIMLEGDQEIQYDHCSGGNESFDFTVEFENSKKDSSFDDAQYDDYNSRLMDGNQSEDEFDSENDDDNHEAAMLEIDEMRSHRGDPLTKEQFQSYFDECGRLVNEHDLRKQIFKGGVDDSIRRDVWTFLFELFPFNSTNREREVLQVENKVFYEALKIRWKNILKSLVIDNDYEGVRYCPKWYKGCLKNGARSTTPVPLNDIDDVENVPSNDSGSVDFPSNNTIQDNVEKSLNHTEDEIRVALADAMQDLEVEDTLLSRHTSDFSDISFIEKALESPDQLNDDDEIPEEERFDNKVFPNPFLLSPEYVNSHESLYSQSENIDSVDIDSFDCKLTKSEIASNGDIDDNVKESCEDDEADLHGENIEPNQSIDSEIVVAVEKSIGFNEIPHVNDGQTEQIGVTTTGEYKCDLKDDKELDESEKSIYDLNYLNENIDCGLTKERNFLNVYNQPTQPMNISKNKINASSFARMDCKHDQERINTKYEKPFIAKSPTGESLEKLPPWIAQMIRASTPTTPDKKAKSKVEVELDECSCQQSREEVELNKERSELNRELLGIVETANKYLEQSMKLQSGPNTPSPGSDRCSPILEKDTRENKVKTPTGSDVKDKDSKQTNESLFLTPISSTEADVFLNNTPCLKLVTDSSPESPSYDENESSRPCPYCTYNTKTSNKIVLPQSLGEDQLKFMEIQAQLFAARQPFKEKRIAESVRVIDKDVPRTDREIDMFQGNSDPGLLRLRDALLTYAFFHPEVGYAQGMNDIMARFLYVMDDEAEAYWMFLRYMEHFKNDFMEEGMLKKIAQVEQLLMKMDRELYDFLHETDMGLIFCHRWLLLNFKREFEYNEAVRLFEITSSRHLEVSSLSAEIERSKERAKEFVKDKAGSHMEEVFLLPEYPFDVFVCVAMLMECRDMVMGTPDISTVYQILSNLPKTLELKQVLRRSEELFYRYCRKTTVDCFQVIDDHEIPDQKRSRLSFSFSFR